MRALAGVLGVSLATVSEALRGDKRVSAGTRERVRRAAAEMGYVYNPLAGSVMSGIRRSSLSSFRGTVAVVDRESPKARVSGTRAYHQLVKDGAEDAARRLGYQVEFFDAPDAELTIRRLGDTLNSRGITAALFLPMFGKPNISALNW